MNIVRILLLDDDDSNVNSITKYFQPLGAEVVFTSSIDEAIDHLRNTSPSLFLVSLSLAHNNNWFFLDKAKKSLGPIIGLVEKDQSSWMMQGWTHGINAYLVKPLDYMHLKTYLPSALAQVWAIKKRVNSTDERRCLVDRRIVGMGRRWYDRLSQINNAEIEEKGPASFGPFTICSDKKLVTRNGKVVKLTPTEFKLLMLLFRNRDQVVSMETIISHIWNSNNRASEEDVKQYIYMLRKKIETTPSKPSLILNHKGFGYMFSSAVFGSGAVS